MIRLTNKGILFFLLQVLNATYGFPQAGSLDSTFGINGIVTTLIGDYSTAIGLGLQSDGKIVAVGESPDGPAIVRYKPNGTLDNTFGIGGIVVVSTIPLLYGTNVFYGEAIQADDKILVSGTANNGLLFLMRFKPDGLIDSAFGTNGTASAWAFAAQDAVCFSIVIQPDDKIIAGGYSQADIPMHWKYLSLARFNPDGSLDSGFINGVATDDATGGGVSLQQDGKIISSGVIDSGDLYPTKYLGLFRYNEDGTPDVSFGNNGVVSTKIDSFVLWGSGATIDSSGKILTSDYLVSPEDYTPVFRMTRHKTDGSLDSTFGNNGILMPFGSNSDVGSIIIQSDQKILGSGIKEGHHVLYRLNNDGSFDNSFGIGGIAEYTPMNNNLGIRFIQPDGKILAIGGGNGGGFHLTRFQAILEVGILNLSSDNLPTLIYPNPIQSYTKLQYTLQSEQSITITLCNLQGSIVQTFFSNESRAQGEHSETLSFDESLPPGEYILSISNGVNRQGIKITIVR